MIKAPYNFVPLSEKVVMPFWADHISQDIPFKNAKSGSLRLKITAESPIYVRNGMPRDAKDDDPKRNDFNNINGNYFIPGSSIKGMLRSVVEIMSFGRMKNKVNKHKYSVRDFQNNDIYPKTDLSNKVECGWLYKIGDEYFIDKCGKPGRISHKSIDDFFNSTIAEFFSKKSNLKKTIKIDKEWITAKSARFKYEQFKQVRKENRFIGIENKLNQFEINDEGEKGEIIFTGQSGERFFDKKDKKWKGKHLEFIFWDKEPTRTPVPDEVIKNFFFAYYDHDKTQQKEDWKWRKLQLEKEGKRIPVFYRTHEVNGKKEFQDIGLTMLYKITYSNSILDSINKHQKEADSYDLAEVIFGYVEGDQALKGRVHIGHAFVSNGKPSPLSERIEVLAGPKASYYPNYIEQDPNENGTVRRYKTFMDSEAKIRGWKRYPVHSGEVKKNPPPVIKGRVNERVASKFIPLPKKTEFTLDIAYHNLREEELGALISAITFHNTDGLYHSIGSAKPLGYGKIKLTIEDGLTKDEQINAMKAYEAFMDCALGHSTPLWFQTPQIRELLAMAKPGNEDHKLTYMELKDFVNAKGWRRTDPKYALLRHSLISQVYMDSMIDKELLNQTKNLYENEKNQFEKPGDIRELGEYKLRKNQLNLEQKLRSLKRELLNELANRKSIISEKERKKQEKIAEQKRIEERNKRQMKAMKRGFVLPENFDFSHRDAFNNFSNSVLKYVENLHQKTENQLKKEFADKAWVKEDDFEVIASSVVKIYKNLPNKREIKKWSKTPLKTNFAFRKIKEWVGEQKAKEIFDDLLK